MFNMYTKVATALGAFALLFSTGAWGQCADGEIAVDFTLSVVIGPSKSPGNSTMHWRQPVLWRCPRRGTMVLDSGDYTFIGL